MGDMPIGVTHRGRRLLLVAIGVCATLPNCEPSQRASGEPVRPVRRALSWHVSQMNGPRAQHAAVALADGRVLVCGGSIDYGFSALDSCDVYDPKSETWSADAWPSLPSARLQETLTLLGDGRVLVAGGFDGFLTLGEARTGASSGWASDEDIEPIASRDRASATRFSDNHVLLLSGDVFSAEETGRQGVGNLRVPDDDGIAPAERWSVIAAPPFAVAVEHTATLLSGDHRLLVAGGFGADDKPVSTVQIYDVDAGTWQLATSMKIARGGHTATRLDDGRVLVVGGAGFDGQVPLAQAEIYDPQANVWTLSGVSSVPRTEHVAGRLGPYVVVAGGGDFQNTLDSVELFDPATQAFRPLSALSERRQLAQMTATHTTTGQPALLVSGGTSNIASSTADLIAPALLGRPCSDAAQCASGYCADGVCCDGACSGTCQACNLSGDGLCRNVSGAPQSSHGACPNGFVCDGQGACTTVCSSSDGCAPGFFCDGSRCVTRFSAGQRCNAGGQCEANLVCSQGVCCKTACGGACQSCNASGDCVPFVGTPRPGGDCPTEFDPGCAPRCDGVSASCTFPAHVSCGSARCDAAGGFAVAPGACDGSGRCQQASVGCAGYACDGSECRTGCTRDEECGAGYQCADGEHCSPLDGLGQLCGDGPSDAGVCPSGLSCVGGVCCASSCGARSHCVAPSFTCRELRGTDCSVGAECDTGFCVDGVCCEQMACGPGASCREGAGSCKLSIGTRCEASADCGSGFCTDGVCCNQPSCEVGSSCALANQPGSCKVKNGGACSDDASCGSARCPAGTCVECATDGDCALPSRCDPEGHCRVPPAPKTQSAGCAVVARTPGSGGAFDLLIALAWLAERWRSRARRRVRGAP